MFLLVGAFSPGASSTMDVALWAVMSITVTPCVFPTQAKRCWRGFWKCCCKCRGDENLDDPEHAAKLSDVGGDLESGQQRATDASRGKAIGSVLLRVMLCLLVGYLITLALLALVVGVWGGSYVRRAATKSRNRRLVLVLTFCCVLDTAQVCVCS